MRLCGWFFEQKLTCDETQAVRRTEPLSSSTDQSRDRKVTAAKEVKAWFEERFKTGSNRWFFSKLHEKINMQGWGKEKGNTKMNFREISRVDKCSYLTEIDGELRELWLRQAEEHAEVGTGGLSEGRDGGDGAGRDSEGT
ncbi:hypothetical protein RJ640_009340 [Escallonia rubra]|uniref:Uncharacterized protein n=1 Tax=Escallonia rubra TaxID=112253 RepID=A0AA88TZK9_9ASTE|nr:hypothetical protein RJ640_009340 [Escallonia rubra]